MKKRDVLLYIEDIIDAMNKIEEYIKGLSYEEFINNSLITDAVLRNLEIIGEASKNVPQYVKDKYPDIPWKRMTGLRNIVIHGYFTVDLDIIWKIISEDIPKTKSKIEKLLQMLKED